MRIDQRSRSARAECGARPTAPAAAPARDRAHRAAAGFRRRSARPARPRATPARAASAAIAARASRPRRRIRTACGRDIPAARRSRRERRVVEQVAAEDREQARLRHERRQRQEHEVALRTLSAPAIGGLRRGCGSCGCSWRTRRRSASCARSAGDRQFRQRPQQREVIQIARRRATCSNAWKRCSNSQPLLHWWFTCWPSYSSVALDAERSFENAIVSYPYSIAATARIAELIAVTGMWPLHAPCRLYSNSSGASFAPDVQRRQAGALGARRDQRRVADPDRGRRLARRRLAAASTLTSESLPPPIGTSVRRISAEALPFKAVWRGDGFASSFRPMSTPLP